MSDSDHTWQYYGRADPYFGVLTRPEFRHDRLTADGRREFFESGKRYVEFILSLVRATLDPSFRPTRALDFGCGVGRLAIPLATACESVVGVDVSEAMLAEARSNSQREGAANASFVRGDDALSRVQGDFDLLNSLIVFQHIPPPRGEAILRRMLKLLREGGVGALQFTYGFASSASLSRRLLIKAYRTIPLFWECRNLLKGEPLRRPLMQMYEYDLNQLLRILQESGSHVVHLHFTETSVFGHPFYGVILLFQKKRLDPTAHA